MMPGMDPKAMARAMKQMGIKNEEIPATKVIIEQDDSKLIIQNPQVTKITMQGQSSFQIVGDVQEQSVIKDDDIQMVVDSANVSSEVAKKALEDAKGDIAEAIMNLGKDTADENNQ